jgi:hypothetical protein
MVVIQLSSYINFYHSVSEQQTGISSAQVLLRNAFYGEEGGGELETWLNAVDES